MSVPVTSDKPAALPSYDFAQFVNYGRLAQLGALAIQTLVVYSEWDRIGSGYFFLLLVLFGLHGANVFVRWRDAIDGRFDMKQLLNTKNAQLRAQYGLALFISPILALFTWFFFCPEGMAFLSGSIYLICNLTKVAGAVGILSLEIYEVSKEIMAQKKK